ncbi:MAG: helix-turn-helix domain-containing protein, partial [Solobacterium sp.]|nr:helix-turn-helix domain-containing protein [Solobacterium sp.]
MTNLLPEKLTTLRKRYHYAQGDIAARINVPVSEYMKWENGSTLCRIEQLILLADLYRVPLQALVDNTAVLDLPDPEHDYDSIEIPSFSGSAKGTGIELDQAQAQEILYGMPPSEDSVEIPLADDVSYRQMVPPSSGDTVKVPAVKEEPLSNTREFASTRVIQISDIRALEPVKQPAAEPEEPKGNRKALYVIIAVVLALIAGLLRMLGNRDTEDPVLLDVNQEDRLVLGERFSGYVSEQYRLTTMGTTAELTGFTDLVKISAGPDVLLGLKRDGTAVTTGRYDTADWDHLVDIAAGERHISAVKDDGTVVCTGNDTACDVSQWTGISAVYAGKDLTAGLDADGRLHVSGSGTLAEALDGKNPVKDLALASEGAVILYRDGTMETFGNLSALKPQMSGAVSVAAGNSFAAVLDNTGNVRVFCADREFGKAAEKWTGIRYIAGRGKTLVALTSEGKIIGLGDNFYNVYNKDSSSEPVEKTKLSAVTNVSFSVTVSGLVINWDSVENAKYYEVIVSTQPQ